MAPSLLLKEAIYEEREVKAALNGIGVHLRTTKDPARVGQFLETNGCWLKVEPSIHVCVVLAPAEDRDSFIAAVLLEAGVKCLYISYRCVGKARRNEGWGVFLGFLAAYFARLCGLHYVFSTGVSGQRTVVNYTRIDGTKEMDLSQMIQITKLGFRDLWKKEGYSNELLTELMKYCGESAETVLDLKDGDLALYEAYMRSVLADTRVLFRRYLRNTNT